MEPINSPVLTISGNHLAGKNINKIYRKIADMKGLYADEAAFASFDETTILYDVESFLPVADGTEGGLFFGITHIHPGKIGKEYFMTKGHLHTIENRAEYYWGIEGEGVLLTMDSDRNTRGERVFPGSLHYISGRTAHRVINTGTSMLSFGACWPSDAGHNYESIASEGFSMRVMEVDGKPQLV